MKTPITPESLIELGFVEDTFNELYYKLPNVTTDNQKFNKIQSFVQKELGLLCKKGASL